MRKNKRIGFNITTDMSCEQMAPNIMSAAPEAMGAGRNAAVIEILPTGLELLQASYTDDPRVLALRSQVATVVGISEARRYRAGELA